MSATARAITESHVPSDAMRADALESDPETPAARSEGALIVASGSTSSSCACTSPMSSTDAACT